MANSYQHADRARRFQSAATTIVESDSEASGEVKWLAVVQAAHCVGHLQSADYHPHSRNGIRNIIGRLRLRQQQRTLLSYALDATFRHLHIAAHGPHSADAIQHNQAHEYADYLIHVLLQYHENNPYNHA